MEAARDTPPRVAVITGGASGIGAALVAKLKAQGTRVVILDRAAPPEGAEDWHQIDLTDGPTSSALFEHVAGTLPAIDLWISAAGLATGEPDGPASASDTVWQTSFELHVMAHLRAARIVLPKMQAQGAGSFVNIASAAGFLTQIGDAAYSAGKAAAVSLAQSLAIAHARDALHIGVVCPLYVATPMIGYGTDTPPDLPDGVITAEAVAEHILSGIAQRQFLIAPHPELHAYAKRRANDPERWIEGMKRLHDSLATDGPLGSLTELHRRM